MPHVDDGRLRTLWLCERCGSVTDGGPHECEPLLDSAFRERECGNCRYWDSRVMARGYCREPFRRFSLVNTRADWYCTGWDDRNAER